MMISYFIKGGGAAGMLHDYKRSSKASPSPTILHADLSLAEVKEMKCIFVVACLLLLGSHGALSALTPTESLGQLGFFFAKVKDMVNLNLK